MIEELAIVVKTEAHQVWVTGGQQAACGGCQQKTSCTTSTLASTFKKKPIPISSDLHVKVGDTVIVAMDEDLLLRSTLLVYCLPLVALFVGAGIADSLLGTTKYADLWVALSATISLSASLALVNRIQGAWFMGQLPTPIIIKKL